MELCNFTPGMTDEELKALVNIFREYRKTLENYEPSEDYHKTYSEICEHLENLWKETDGSEAMTDTEVMELFIKDVGTMALLWWMWNDTRNDGLKQNPDPTPN